MVIVIESIFLFFNYFFFDHVLTISFSFEIIYTGFNSPDLNPHHFHVTNQTVTVFPRLYVVTRDSR